jgi:hypothetical protein
MEVGGHCFGYGFTESGSGSGSRLVRNPDPDQDFYEKKIFLIKKPSVYQLKLLRKTFRLQEKSPAQ